MTDAPLGEPNAQRDVGAAVAILRAPLQAGVVATTVSEFDQHRRFGQCSLDQLPEQFSHRHVEFGRTDLQGAMDLAGQVKRESLDALTRGSGRRCHNATVAQSLRVPVSQCFCASVYKVKCVPLTTRHSRYLG